MTLKSETIVKERVRIQNEYLRREIEIDSDIYAPWQPAESFFVSERRSLAALLLHEHEKFPIAGDRCLEIGYGKLGWLSDFISWGMRETDLSGIELDEKRALIAQNALPNADLRTGDATSLPWENESFKIIVVSTVFSSILDANMRKDIAAEIERVLIPGGVLLWYDLARDNPRNSNVKSIKTDELQKLFPKFTTHIRRVTLAPPIARFIVPRNRTLAAFLSSIPMLRTHLLGLLIKKGLE